MSPLLKDLMLSSMEAKVPQTSQASPSPAPKESLKPSDITSLFSTPPTTLLRALSSLEAGHPLKAIQQLLAALNIPASLLGERFTILAPGTAPLSSAVRITPSNSNDGYVYVHNLLAGTEEKVSMATAQDLESFAGRMLRLQEELESGKGYLRRVPRSADALLSILRGTRFTEELWFTEAYRAVERDCLLDATVNLLAPFGFVPQELGGEFVTLAFADLLWDTRPNLKNVEITRLDRYVALPDATAPCSAVVVTGLRTSRVDQLERNSSRRLMDVLRSHGIQGETTDEGAALPQKALVYELGMNADRVALVERLLAYKSEGRANSMLFGERPFTVGKHSLPRPIRESSELAEKKMQRLQRISPLRNEVRVEALLEEERRRREEEARRKKLEDRAAEMRREGLKRFEKQRDEEKKREAERKKQKRWADMVEEEEEDDDFDFSLP